MAFCPGRSADHSAAVPRLAVRAGRGSRRPRVDGRRYSSTLRGRAHDSTYTPSLLLLLVVQVLSSSHDATNDDLRNRRVIIWTSSTPLDTATDATLAETMNAALFSQAPRSFPMSVRLKAQVTLPPFLQDQVCRGSGSWITDAILRGCGLSLNIREACRLYIRWTWLCGAWCRRRRRCPQLLLIQSACGFYIIQSARGFYIVQSARGSSRARWLRLSLWLQWWRGKRNWPWARQHDGAARKP
mmetsp:Transcript_107657/g.195869  ORF Transcript_107657/g.195869 Transcript_107657/m.195869 type:complete len:242 (-) Transcript_107657:14-739(-)